MKIAVGLSGGVDSSVVAYLLKEEGNDVVGVTMSFTDESLKNGGDAERVAEELKIPFYNIDLRKEYEEKVKTYIKNDYLHGRTPNPCVKCNKEVKFGVFLDKIVEQGISFDKFATGHYAIIDYVNNRYNLKKGIYSEKDQTYFLATLTQQQLSKIIFPLGYLKKWKVRRIAKKAKLFVYDKEESQDLCMGNYKQIFDGDEPSVGNFVDKESGKILGEHRGIFNYTIGQRRGLDIGGGLPLYVLQIDPDSNNIYVGTADKLISKKTILRDVNFIGLQNPEEGWEGIGKIRYRDEGSPVQISKIISNNKIEVTFKNGVRAITPGQLCVVYDGDYVAFSGYMEE